MPLLPSQVASGAQHLRRPSLAGENPHGLRDGLSQGIAFLERIGQELEPGPITVDHHNRCKLLHGAAGLLAFAGRKVQFNDEPGPEDLLQR